MIRGLNFVATQKTNNNAACPAGTVANLSLGGAYSAALNNAAAALVGYGVFVAVASGGDDDDAVRYSPASESTVCTVSASDENDTVAASSNWGALVDVYAPGKDVLSTWNTGPSATVSLLCVVCCVLRVAFACLFTCLLVCLLRLAEFAPVIAIAAMV